jgi:hypothetical protein
MPFKYTTEPDKIVFTRLSAGCGSSIFVIVGSIFTLIGVGLFVFTENPEMPLSMMRFIFPAFGLVAVIAGINLPKIQKRSTPDRIMFDNRNGRVEVSQEVSDIKTGYIYYDEIRDLVIKAKKVESTGSGRSSRTYYTYHIYLEKNDGGQWELLRFNTESAAQEELLKLKILVNLSAVPQRVPSQIHQSQKYRITDVANKTEISWRNPLGYGPLALFLFACLFLSVTYTIFSMMRGEVDYFFYGVGGFIMIVFFFVVGGHILKMVKNAKTVYAVTVSSSSLDYYERDLAGRIMKNIQFPMADLHALSFSFDTDQTLRKIYIYTHDQFIKKDAMNPSFSLEYVREVYNFYKSLVALDLQELTAVEALQVENFLQERIKDIGRTTVA